MVRKAARSLFIQNARNLITARTAAIQRHIDGHGLFDINYLRNDKQRKWVLSNSNNQKVMMYFDSNAEMTE